MVSFKSPRYRGEMPCSVNPWNIGQLTNLPFNCDGCFRVSGYDGLKDHYIYSVKAPEIIYKNSTETDFFKKNTLSGLPPNYGNTNFYPGYVGINDTLLIDECEVTNISWNEFLFYFKKTNSSAEYKKMLPRQDKQPIENYLNDPFFRFYPVVGISYQQALAYCEWRTELLNQRLIDENYKIICRLPSIKEWELIASCGLDTKVFPYGAATNKDLFKIKPNSGKYFIHKNNLPYSIMEVNNMIKNFNQNLTPIFRFNCKQETTKFLTQETPNYVYNLPVSSVGLYNMLGNVSEMVAEYGTSKGGSYRHGIEFCKIENSIPYSEPEDYLGFRTICEIVER